MPTRLSTGLIMELSLPKKEMLALDRTLDHVKVYLMDKYSIDLDCYIMHENDENWFWTPRTEWIEVELFSYLARYYAAMYPVELAFCREVLEFVDGASYMHIIDYLDKGGSPYFANDYWAVPIRYDFFTNKHIYHIDINVSRLVRLGVDNKSLVTKSNYVLPFANKAIVEKFNKYRISGMHYVYGSG